MGNYTPYIIAVLIGLTIPTAGDSIPCNDTAISITMQVSHKPQRTVLTKKAKNPVDVPTSSRRFRPTNEGTEYEEIFCKYYNGQLHLHVIGQPGEMRIKITLPSGKQKLYRVNNKRPLTVSIGFETGDYDVEIRTSNGSEAVFLFTLED